MLDVNLDHSGLPSHQNKGTCATLMDISLTGATPSNHAEQYGGAKRTDTSVMDISKEKEFSSSMGADATVTDISMTRTGQQGPHGMKRSSMTLANDATVTDISGRGQIGTMKPPRVSTEGTDATVTDISGAPHARNTTSSAETNKGIGKGA